MFLKNYFASDINSSKCLHAMSSNLLFCTHYIDDVIFHIFSYSDVSIRFYGKNCYCHVRIFDEKRSKKNMNIFVLKKKMII